MVMERKMIKKEFYSCVKVVNLDTREVTVFNGDELRDFKGDILNITPTKSDDILLLWRRTPSKPIEGVKIKFFDIFGGGGRYPSLFDITPVTTGELCNKTLYIYHGSSRETTYTRREWSLRGGKPFASFQVRNWRRFWLSEEPCQFSFYRETGRDNIHTDVYAQ